MSEKKMTNVINEAEFLHQYTHPNLITSYCSFFDSDTVMAKKKDEEVFKNQKRYNFYIVMEYAPKGDLL
jgi:serine/threonine protein kinase